MLPVPYDPKLSSPGLLRAEIVPYGAYEGPLADRGFGATRAEAGENSVSIPIERPKGRRGNG